MPLILGSQSALATGFSVNNSCRFNYSDGRMQRSFTAGDPDVWTFSAWLKRSHVLVGYPKIVQGFNPAVPADNADTSAYMELDDNLKYSNWNSGDTGRLITDAMYRDPTAWFHILILYNSDDVTAGDRMQVWINGVEETDFSTDTNPSSGQNTNFNQSGMVNYLGSHVGADDSNLWSGYMAEVAFVDGTAYTASDFGEFNEDSPTIWQPKDFAADITFGTNGYYLDFQDSSNLGNDVSGEGNDLTTNGMDAADQATDSPSNNFATFNNLNYPSTGAAVSFSDGNTIVTTQDASANYFGGTSTLGMTAGKWYCEFKASSLTGAGMVGITGIPAEQARNSQQTSYTANGFSYVNDGNKKTDAVGSAYGATYTTSNVIGIAVDLDNLKIYFAKDNTWQDSGDPTSGATGTGAAFTILAASATPEGHYVFSCADNSSGASTWGINCGGCSGFVISSAESDENGYGNFEYAPPSGYLALCTKNLGSDGG